MPDAGHGYAAGCCRPQAPAPGAVCNRCPLAKQLQGLALLAALPESVIEMQLEAAAASHAREALDAALVRLKQLRKLSMSQELREFGGNIHLQLPALRMLSCLTCLELNAIVCNVCMRLVPHPLLARACSLDMLVCPNAHG